MSKTVEEINAIADEIHKINQKWWFDLHTGEPLDRNLGEVCMLMISEVSEAMEGERKGLKDDKLTHRPMAEVEMADTVIRLLDASRGYGWSIEWGTIPAHKTGNRGEELLYICELILDLYNVRTYNNGEKFADVMRGVMVSRILAAIIGYCERYDYDLWGAVEEKNAYNAVRHDHTKAARLEDGGKKW